MAYFTQDDKDKVLTFGQHKGETIGTLLDTQPQYLIWCHNNIDWFELSSELLEEAEKGNLCTICGVKSIYRDGSCYKCWAEEHD